MELKFIVIICMILILFGCKPEPPVEGMPGEPGIEPKSITNVLPLNIPKKQPEITGQVIGDECIAYTNFIFQDAINVDPSYIRIKMYDPIGSSSLRNLQSSFGMDDAMDVADAILDDLATRDLFKLKAVCDECGQSIAMRINSLNYLGSLKPQIDEWTESLRYICTDCPSSKVSIVEEGIITENEIASYATQLTQGLINPDKIFGDLLGEMDDFYDNMPRTYSFTQACPDFVPRFVFVLLLPVFKDRNGEVVEYPYNWETMAYDVDWNELGSYSVPKSLNLLSTPIPGNMLQHQFLPEAYTYYLAELDSFPKGIINKTFYFRNQQQFEAPVEATLNGGIYKFDEWKIEQGAEKLTWNSIMLRKISRATANYKKIGDVPPIVDLAVSNIGTSEKDKRYTITFEIVNHGEENLEKDLFVDISVDDRILDHIKISGGVPAGGSVEKSITVNEFEIFDDNDQAKLLKFSVDPDDWIVETDENNNNKLFQVRKAEQPMPDIVVKDIVISPRKPVKNEQAEVTFTVANLGDTEASVAQIEVQLGNEHITTATFNNLAAGISFNTGFKTNFKHCGQHLLNFYVKEVYPSQKNNVNDWSSKEIDINCGGTDCSSITDYYSCGAGSCSGGNCIWSPIKNRCDCASREDSCLNVCSPNHGTCYRSQCPYPNTFYQPSGDNWCINDRAGDQSYMCCCNIPEEQSQPEVQQPKILPPKELIEKLPELAPKEEPAKLKKLILPRITARVVINARASAFNMGALVLGIFAIIALVFANSRRIQNN